MLREFEAELKEQGNKSALALLERLRSEREKPVRRPRRAPKMTPLLGYQIRLMRQLQPEFTQAEIAAHFKVSQGRVSEALRGRYQ